MEDKILILTGENKKLAGRLFREPDGSVRKGKLDTDRLMELLRKAGFEAELKTFSALSADADVRDTYVLYASSEDEGLFYKQYIEDALLSLKLRGAVLIPSFPYFRAHGNKVFQERLRQGFSDARLKAPRAVTVGDITELPQAAAQLSFPAVVKVSAGSGSRGVILVHSRAELEAACKKLMRHFYRDFGYTYYLRFGLFVKRLLRRITGRRTGNEMLLRSSFTNPVVIQSCIEGLEGDYKVLYFEGRYFVLFRKNRAGDFRASGSGDFRFPEDVEEVREVLRLACAAAREIGMPMISLDIAKSRDACFLLEFQCVYFGPYTLQFAPCCFEEEAGAFVVRKGSFLLEEEYARAVASYIRRTGGAR